MSHKTSALTPWITSFTDSFSVTGSSTLTLTGFGLSPSTDVDLGTLGTETGRTYTATDGSGNGNLVISLNVATLPSTPATVQVAVSNGGVPAVQSPLSVQHGWNPGVLCTGDKDYWWNPDSLSLNDGDKVASFTDSVNGLTMIETDGADQLTFKDSDFVWSGSKTAAALHATDSGDGMRGTHVPLEETGGVVTGFTIACIAKSSTVNTSDMSVVMGQGGNSQTHRYLLSLYEDRAKTWVAGTITDTSFASSWDGGIVTPILTGAGGSATFTVPELSHTQSISYTEKTQSTIGGTFAATFNEAYFGEILILSRELTASEITQLRAYWADKYGS